MTAVAAGVRRALVYLHDNPHGHLADHVVHQLTELRPWFAAVAVVSRSALEDRARDRLLAVADTVVRADGTRSADAWSADAWSADAWSDDLAWRAGLAALGGQESGGDEHDGAAGFDVVTLMTDAEFGPLGDLGGLFATMDAGGGRWELSSRGATPAARPAAPGTEPGSPHDLLDSGAPFVPVAAFRARPEHASAALRRMADLGFPAGLAAAHLSQLGQADQVEYLAAKQAAYELAPVVPPPPGPESAPSLRIAVHLHVHYLDLLDEFLDAFDGFEFAYALLVTADTPGTVRAVEEELARRGRDAEVTLVPPRGRDIYPLQLLAARLADFDVVGHFHTKKSVSQHPSVGEGWRHELMDMLVAPAHAIVADLAATPGLGVVIADIPTFFRYVKIVDAANESRMAPQMNELWARMGLDRPIDFRTRDTFVMSYGTFFWARVDAVAPLLALDLGAEIPAEPLGQNTVLHCLERLLVYVAWARGYDFRIAQGRYVTPFVDVATLNTRGRGVGGAWAAAVRRVLPRRVRALLRGRAR